MKHIGYIQTEFKEKFGIPRQSGLVSGERGLVSLVGEFRNPEAFKGLEDFSHIWILWEFSQAKSDKFNATVRPPKLGGNTRMGVFATRSPFRPNSIGMSVVKLEKIEYSEDKGVLLHVSGVDMLDGTPVLDIKPYLPNVDSIEGARGGFTEKIDYKLLTVNTDDYLQNVDDETLDKIIKIIEQDPRPSYIEDPDRVYGFRYSLYDVSFLVKGNVAYLQHTTKVE